MSPEHAKSRLARIPPPILFAVSFLVGFGLQKLVPIPLPAWLESAMVGAGFVALALGIILAASCVTRFFRLRTTIVPHGKPSTLILTGPYRYSRNPMYLSVTLVYIGAALLSGDVWPLVALAVPLVFLNRVIIPMEEQSLLAQFGSTYIQYTRKVRRWI